MRLKALAVRRAAICPLLLLAAVLVFHRRVLFHEDASFPWDFRGFHLPLATAYADAVSERRLPLWDPYTYCGRPLLANPQVAVFYPGMLLAVLPGRAGLLQRLEWLAALHVFLAGLFTFRLGRRLGLSNPAALFAGLVFELGGFFVSQIEHLSAVCAAPWLVLAWLAVLLPSPRRILLLSFAWAMSFFAGFPAFTLMTVAATALFALSRKPRSPALRDLLLGGALATGLVCVQLGPALELVGQSVGKYRTDWLQWGEGLPPAALISLAVPDYFGVFDPARHKASYDITLMYLFSGWTALGLVTVAAWRRKWRNVALSVCFLVLMLGKYTPAGRALYAALPRSIERTLYWHLFMAPFLLALCLLAAEGLDQLRGMSRRGPRIAWALCGIAALELTAVGSNRPLNTEAVREKAPLAAHPSVARLRALAGDLRIDTANDSLELISAAPILCWRVANGYDPLALERLIQARLAAARGARWGAYYQIEQPDSPALDWMSVRVLTSRTRLKTLRLKEFGEQDGRWMYVNPGALPRYRATGCSVGVITENPNSVELSVRCAEPALLETSEAYYSAWRAAIDGRPAPGLVVNRAFRAVAVPAGLHRVVFWYSTSLLLWCAVVSAAAWSVWAWLVGREARRPRPQHPASRSGF